MPKRKKASHQEAAEDSNDASDAQAEELHHRATRRRRPTEKQAQMRISVVDNRRTTMDKEVKDLMLKLKTLKKAAKQLDDGQGHDEESSPDVESEEEDPDVVLQRQNKSAFESRGIYNAPTTAGKRLQLRREYHNANTHITYLSLPKVASTATSAPQRSVASSAGVLGMPDHPHPSSAASRGRSRSCTPLHVHGHSQSSGSHPIRSSSPPAHRSHSRSSGASACIAPFRDGKTPSGKPKAGDYEPHVRKLINHACHQYEVLLATEQPFPEVGTPVLWASRVWMDVCRGAQLHYTLCDRIEKIITARVSHARGGLRDKVRPLIAPTYGLLSDGSERSKAKNIARYTFLLDRDAPDPEPRFHYKDVELKQGFAHNMIVTTVIKAQWFADA
ncbi:hypothetical protein BD414DRAFT_522315, partial [Trametes punicea]